MTKSDIISFYVLPAIMIVLSITAAFVVAYFAYKRKENPILTTITIATCIFAVFLGVFFIKDTSERFTQSENATLLYEDIRIYTDNDTGEYFRIGYDENEKYCRYYLDEETVQRMRDYADGKIKKANNLDIFIDENGKYIVFDNDFKEAGTITIS